MLIVFIVRCYVLYLYFNSFYCFYMLIRFYCFAVFLRRLWSGGEASDRPDTRLELLTRISSIRFFPPLSHLESNKVHF